MFGKLLGGGQNGNGSRGLNHQLRGRKTTRLQLLHTLTPGIISSKGGLATGLADYEDFIQTDASINPGNSGGAQADSDGNVVGINTAIGSPTGGNVGIGFASPVNMAIAVMDSLVSEGRVRPRAALQRPDGSRRETSGSLSSRQGRDEQAR